MNTLSENAINPKCDFCSSGRVSLVLVTYVPTVTCLLYVPTVTCTLGIQQGKVVCPMRIVNPDQEQYSGLVQVGADGMYMFTVCFYCYMFSLCPYCNMYTGNTAG